MLRLWDSRFSFILATLCLALLTACIRRANVPRPIDKAAATATLLSEDTVE